MHSNICTLIFVVITVFINVTTADEISQFCDFHTTESGCLEQCGCNYCDSDKKCYNADYVVKYCPQNIISNKLECQIRSLGEQLKQKDNEITDKNKQTKDLGDSLFGWQLAFWTGLAIILFAAIVTSVLVYSLHDDYTKLANNVRKCDRCKHHIRIRF
jgi:hypothetical protein